MHALSSPPAPGRRLNIVDPTKYAKVQSIMKRRMQFAKSINCTGVDPDNVDAWAEENTGINGITFDVSGCEGGKAGHHMVLCASQRPC